MRQLTFSVIRVRSRATGRSRGLLLAGARPIPVVLGRAGVAADKREGDGSTPRGRFRLLPPATDLMFGTVPIAHPDCEARSILRNQLAH